MSTKFATSIPAPESRGKRGTLVSKVPDGVVARDLSDRNLSISVRALNPDTDVPVLYGWMRSQYASLVDRDIPPRELEESYASMIESDFAKPFIGLVNEMAVCQLDIYKTLQDTLSLYYHARPDDYGLQLALAPLSIKENIALVLRTSLEHFFTFPEVGRIVADVEVTNEWANTLFRMAGFRFHKKISVPYKTANLYIITRDLLKEG